MHPGGPSVRSADRPNGCGGVVSSAMILRVAEQRDIPAIVELITGLADFEKLPGPDAGASARLARHLSEGKVQLLVAELDGAVAAYAAWFYTYSTFRAQPGLYLEDLYVRPDL